MIHEKTPNYNRIFDFTTELGLLKNTKIVKNAKKDQSGPTKTQRRYKMEIGDKKCKKCDVQFEKTQGLKIREQKC